MIGQNDDRGAFDQGDARGLIDFANTTHIGFVSFWETVRDRNACNGPLFQCTNIPQARFDFSKAFNGFRG